jgi:alkylation response protein AidB-like acyl-CoA dehydrogenase
MLRGRMLTALTDDQQALTDLAARLAADRFAPNARAAIGAGHGAPPPLEASVAKCFANETAKRVSDLAIQLHGGYGYSAEYKLERLHRDSHGWAIAGGTVSMQRIRIASEYLGIRPNQRA